MITREAPRIANSSLALLEMWLANHTLLARLASCILVMFSHLTHALFTLQSAWSLLATCITPMSIYALAIPKSVGNFPFEISNPEALVEEHRSLLQSLSKLVLPHRGHHLF